MSGGPDEVIRAAAAAASKRTADARKAAVVATTHPVDRKAASVAALADSATALDVDCERCDGVEWAAGAKRCESVTLRNATDEHLRAGLSQWTGAVHVTVAASPHLTTAGWLAVATGAEAVACKAGTGMAASASIESSTARDASVSGGAPRSPRGGGPVAGVSSRVACLTLDGCAAPDAVLAQVFRGLRRHGGLHRLRIRNAAVWSGAGLDHLSFVTGSDGAGSSRALGDGSAVFSSVQHTLRHLDVTGSGGVGDETLFIVARCLPRLTSLCLRDCPAVSGAGIEAIAGAMLAMEELDVGGCGGVDAAALTAMAGVGAVAASLRKLDVSGTWADSQTVEAFGNLTRLSHLSLSDCLGVDGVKAFTSLAIAAPLVVLDLSRTGVTDLALSALAESDVITLETLSLRGCMCLEEGGPALPKLARLQGLRRLDLREVPEGVLAGHGGREGIAKLFDEDENRPAVELQL